MCQSKAQGGQRCAIHMHGSRAVMNVAAKISHAPRQEVTEAFKDLRKEGKGLLPPTPEMIEQFAAQQKFQARYNPQLTKNDSQKIQAQWDEAAQEKPDGATFHAWKNVIGEVARRSRAKLAAIIVSASLAATVAACSGSGGNAPSTPPPSAPPSSTSTVDPSEASIIDYTTNTQNGVVLGDSKQDKYGSYQQVSLSDDAPAVQYDASKYPQDVRDRYTDAGLAQAQATSARFIASQVLDNPAIYENSPANLDAFYAESKDYINVSYQEDWKESVYDESVGGSMDTMPPRVLAQGATPVYAEGEGRFVLSGLSLNSAKAAEDGSGVVLTWDLSWDREYEVENQRIGSRAVGTYSMNIAPEQDGTWKLLGWNMDATATELQK